MRSLVLLQTSLRPVPTPDGQLAALASDPATKSLYAIVESAGPDGLAELAVFALSDDYPAVEKARWTTESAVSLLPPVPTVVPSFKYLLESDSLCVVLANGDIEQIFEPSSDIPKRENVGSVDAGIAAAAWSPDEELLALVTGDDKLIVMTKDFEVLSEGQLRSSEFGEDAPVNVGWGEKSTQFHGSVGKSAAFAAGPSVSTLHSSPDDDGAPRISWRGDSAFFTVSTLDPPVGSESLRRNLRVFSRLAVLSSTCEPTGGLEHTLAWQPSGSIIASTQKRVLKDGKVASHHVVFFERNGLRRYDFALREKEDETASKVKELAWNSDSTLLAVWLQRAGADAVQLWHRNNYHWYLKQEVDPQLSGAGRMTSLAWHPEKPLELYLTTTEHVLSFHFCWDVFSSPRPPPSDDGSVAVVDGSKVNLTPFRFVNIPPPMCAATFTASRAGTVPVHVSFSSTSSTVTTLYPDGVVEVWNWKLRAVVHGKAREEIVPPSLVWSSNPIPGSYALQCATLGDGLDAVVAVLLSSAAGNSLLLVGASGEPRSIALLQDTWKLDAAKATFLLQGVDGTLFDVSPSSEDGDFATPSQDVASLPEFCPWMRQVWTSSSNVIVGLSEAGRLYAGTQLVANDATSFTCTPDFLIFSTFAHEAKFVPLAKLDSSSLSLAVTHTEPAGRGGEPADTTIKRAVERGSRIVTVVPSTTSLILQMPRGNLETVCPRPLVLQIVRQDLDAQRYRAAFLTCRRHRIDLNILHDHDPDALLAHIADFVTQIKEVDYLNLFLSGLKNEDVTVTMYRPLVLSHHRPFDTEEKINTLCDMLRTELEKRDVFHYANTILTAHVRKKPPDYEAALKVLAELRAKDASRAEDAVKYIIFLSDANKLFDVALGMYDFSLVLMIAQQSQKDPREYLPFLRELRQLDPYLQRHKIDDHLERYDSALRNLAKAGPEHFEAAMAYTKLHSLYSASLEAFRDAPVHYKIVLGANAEYLMGEKQYAEAGMLFTLGAQPERAVVAYQKANAWPELFHILLTEKRPVSEIKAMAEIVAEALRSKSRFTEAGRVLLEYARDVDAAVGVLVEGKAFVEAIRLTSLYSRKDLIDTHVKPGTLETQAGLLDEINDVTEQLEKQVERFAELEEKKSFNPNQYFCVDGPPAGLDNVELQPDGASDAGTAFTRYTAAPTTAATSQMSSRTARSKRRGNLKRAAGKKGTVYEEMYLLRSFKKSVEDKLGEIQAEVASLLPVLLTLASPTHRSAAVELQTELKALERLMTRRVEGLWVSREREWAEKKEAEKHEREQGVPVDTGAVEEALERVERPRLASVKWSVALLDAWV